jgi:glycosyltransferase involved in cell wall biosynthesis
MTVLSIITVNLNSGSKLLETAKSISDIDNIEWILIDGGSDDFSPTLVSTLPRRPDYWISEKDRGIYDAMNKGITLANSKYVFFLNSGDLLINPEGLLSAVEETEGSSWSLSPIIVSSRPGLEKLVGVSQLSFLLAYLGIRPFPHQGAIFGKQILTSIGNFILEDGLAADQTLMLRCWKRKEPVLLSEAFTLFFLDGVGSNQPVGSLAHQMHRNRSRNWPPLYRISSMVLTRIVVVVVKLRVWCRMREDQF